MTTSEKPLKGIKSSPGKFGRKITGESSKMSENSTPHKSAEYLREKSTEKISYANRLETAIYGAYQMNQLPETGFLRLRQIIGDTRANPPIPAIIPVKKSCWWDGVKTGRFPKPVKLGSRITAWRVEDIRALIASA